MATILLMTPFSKKCCNLIQSFCNNAIKKSRYLTRQFVVNRQQAVIILVHTTDKQTCYLASMSKYRDKLYNIGKTLSFGIYPSSNN